MYHDLAWPGKADGPGQACPARPRPARPAWPGPPGPVRPARPARLARANRRQGFLPPVGRHYGLCSTSMLVNADVSFFALYCSTMCPVIAAARRN